MSEIRVLFCDDSAGVVKGFTNQVAKPLADMVESETCSSVAGVQAFLDEGQSFDVIVSDLNFEKVGGGPKDGLEIIRLAKEHWPGVEPILMTAYEGSLDVRDGQRLASLGVGESSLLAKTDAEDPGVTWLRLRERIQGIALAREGDAEQLKSMRRENRYLRESTSGDALEWAAGRPVEEVSLAIRSDGHSFFAGQIGRSFVMQEVFAKIRRAAALPSDVLIMGPTGTGKELVARAVHELSERKDRPFVKVDLTTTSGNLVESELFGHEKGAFTGADMKKEGLLRSADGGTVFLDEIGNISLDIQAKLLRVLEDRQFRALGSTRDEKIDVRFIAATNVDLARASEGGDFREDLYERLNVVRVVLAPLSARTEDIPLLSACFLDEYRTKFGVEGLRQFDIDALKLLSDQEWPRNIRQLKHAVERLFSEVDVGQETVDRAAVEKVLEIPEAGAGRVSSSGEIFREILEGRVSMTLPELKKKYGEDSVKEVMRRSMVHFRGLPDGDDCECFFGGSSQNAWRQFAFQHGLTWKAVRGSLS